MNSITDGAHIEAGPDLESPYPAAASLPGSGHHAVVTKDEPHLLAELGAVTVGCEASSVLTGRATHVP